ncbi:MAG: sodium:solute symporter family protein [Psychrilyobacter sp.]|uniref:sodium:solute symporter family protein n=1 Tax=Psychrilyobacter sp. TaxID=2586924 RepID=UPI003C774FBD
MNVDIGVIIVYFGFLLAIGYFFKKFASNSTSDYFSGGGKMLWWMVGSTAFMTQFSAWTFTGAAGKAFTDGWTITILFFANAFGYLMNYLFFAEKFRQLRVVTPMEAIRMRFGKVNEQVFTWVNIIPSVLSAAIWLNGLAIFVAAVFNVPMSYTIIVTGGVVVLMSLTGGAWAVIASDFMQMVTIMAVTIVSTIVAIVKGGGVTKLLSVGLPEHPIVGTGVNHFSLFVVWVIFIFAKQFFGTNSIIGGAYRYFAAKDSKNAKKAAGLACILMALGPLVWFFPAWYVAGYYPDTATWGLDNLGGKIKDAAYLVFVRKEMPLGMVGLMMAAIFSATMSSMDSALNRNAGIVVKNFYLSVLKPKAKDAELLKIGRYLTLFFGILIISVALILASLKELSLFNATMYIGSLIAFPMLVPSLLGFFIKKTPDWAPWATIIVGIIVSYLAGFVLTPTVVQHILNLDVPFSGRESGDLKVVLGIIGHIFITGGFFLSTQLFYKGHKNSEREAEVNKFFGNLNKEVISCDVESAECDGDQRTILGKLIMVFSCGILLLTLVPNPFWGRLVFVAIAAIVFTVGFGLNKAANSCKEKIKKVTV